MIMFAYQLNIGDACEVLVVFRKPEKKWVSGKVEEENVLNGTIRVAYAGGESWVSRSDGSRLRPVPSRVDDSARVAGECFLDAR